MSPSSPNEVIAVVIPVYHGVTTMLEDVLDSLDVYLGFPYHAIIVDDATTDGTAAALEEMQARRGNITVIRNPVNRGWGWGMMHNCGQGMRWALQHLEFRALIKMDHDALLIGPNVGPKMLALLTSPGVGLIGTLQPEINRWMWDYRVQPAIKRLAKDHGYFDTLQQFVWSIQAGIMGFSKPFLQAMLERDWLEGKGVNRFGTAGLVEDVLYSILCSACGFRALNAPFILSRHGSASLLQTPYQHFREIGLLAVHPIKQGSSGAGQHNATDDAALRGYFQAIRARERLELIS